jgi:enoyl-CoA hydratase
MGEEDVLIMKIEDGIATVTLNRPEKLNAVNEPLLEELGKRFDTLGHDDGVRVVVLKGNGRAFCAGIDLSGGPPGGRDRQGWKNKFIREIDLFRSMLTLPKPVIAAVHGYALGFGFWLMNAADMVVASEDCKMGAPEIRQSASAFRMLMPANVPRNRAFELMTGEMVNGKTAESMGLVNKAIPSEQLEREVHRLAKKLSLVDPVALRMNKRALNVWYNVPAIDDILAYQVENGAELYSSEPFRRWSQLARELDLKEYLKRRDGPYNQVDEAESR